MTRFDAGKLAALMAAELAKRHIDPESNQHVVASLVQTSLRGVDSHGINLFPHYCRAAEAGRINSRPHISISRTGPSTAVMDADHVRNSTHFGAAAYFGLIAAERDCLGFAFTNADALVKAFGAKEAFFGTNPICFTAPLQNESPFCLDMATSLVSWNKINNYRRENSAWA